MGAERVGKRNRIIGREERLDRFELRVLAAKEWWMGFEDRGIELVNEFNSATKMVKQWAQQRPQVLRWAIVFGSVVLSLVIGLSLRQNVTAPSQLLLLLPAILVSGLYGGMFAGTIAALLGAVLTVIWKVTPTPATLTSEFVALALYSIACGIVLGLCRAQEVQRAEILGFAETLEDKIQQRTVDLETANRELTEFCYSISHDIRAPMRNIVSSSKLLLEEVGPSLDSSTKQRLQAVANSAKKLATWVDDLLRYAKLGRTEIKPEWVNITQIVDEITTHLSEEHWAYSSVTSRIQPNIVTTGDRVLVRMALWNVLENAYKYAKKDRPLLSKSENGARSKARTS